MFFKIDHVGGAHSPGGPVVRTLPSAAGGVVSTPGWIPENPYVLWPKSQKIKQRQYCNRFNKEFKNGLYTHRKKNLKKIYFMIAIP